MMSACAPMTDRGLHTRGKKDHDVLQKVLDSLKHLNLTDLIEREAGGGHFRGHYKVFCGYIWPNGSQVEPRKVDIKQYHLFSVDSEFYTQRFRGQLAQEIYIRSKLNHPNVMTFLGYVLEDGGLPLLVSEWMCHVSADEHVKKHPHCDVIAIVTGLAKGLLYLHNKGVIHSDIRAGNVLISGTGECKIYDFRISRPITKGRNRGDATKSLVPSYGWQGTPRWMAPEFFLLKNNVVEYSKKTDVWAFGMTIYELLTKGVPYVDLQSYAQIKLALSEYELPSFPEDYSTLSLSDLFLWDLCRRCLQTSENRPNMREILSIIRTKPLESDSSSRLDLLKSLTMLAVTHNFEKVKMKFPQADLSGKVVQLESHSRGYGGFSDVYFGRSNVHDKLIAIKRVRHLLQNDLRFVERMVRELQIWVKLHHKNILSLLGFTTDGGLNYLSLITEWMDNGTIIQYIKANKDSITTADILCMAKGIASGLAYLHSQNIVHSDMKSGNVLISAEGEPLLTDFGISHIFSSNSIAPLTTGLHGTTRWLAYEQVTISQEMSVPYTFETDVWSFGMTVLELLTLEVPYVHLKSDPQVTIALYQKVLPPQSQEYDKWSEEYRALWTVCESCWKFDPASRPTMDMVLNQLEHVDSGPLA